MKNLIKRKNHPKSAKNSIFKYQNLIKLKNNPESAKFNFWTSAVNEKPHKTEKQPRIGQKSIFLILIKFQNRPKFNFSTSAVNEKPHKTEKQPRIGQNSIFEHLLLMKNLIKMKNNPESAKFHFLKILMWVKNPIKQKNKPESAKFHFSKFSREWTDQIDQNRPNFTLSTNTNHQTYWMHSWCVPAVFETSHS